MRRHANYIIESFSCVVCASWSFVGCSNKPTAAHSLSINQSNDGTTLQNQGGRFIYFVTISLTNKSCFPSTCTPDAFFRRSICRLSVNYKCHIFFNYYNYILAIYIKNSNSQTPLKSLIQIFPDRLISTRPIKSPILSIYRALIGKLNKSKETTSLLIYKSVPASYSPPIVVHAGEYVKYNLGIISFLFKNKCVSCKQL